MDILSAAAQPGSVVVASDQTEFEHLYPFLRKRFDLALVETFDYLPPWESRLGQAVTRAGGQVWVYAPVDSPLHTWMADRYPQIADHELEGWRLSGWDSR
jgi:hypothetical protein